MTILQISDEFKANFDWDLHVALVNGLHALVFSTHSVGDPEHSHFSLSDEGAIHNMVHMLVVRLPDVRRLKIEQKG